MTTQKTFQVTGEQKMNCGGCESSVKMALGQLPGVAAVEASHQTQLINLTYDPTQLEMEKITQELDWIGYEVALCDDQTLS